MAVDGARDAKVDDASDGHVLVWVGEDADAQLRLRSEELIV